MNRIIATLSVSAIAVSLAGGLQPASAATAHNSQAGGLGASANANDSTVSSRRVKHAAKHAAVTPAADADRDAGMYVVKPQTVPEYFGHGAGSDGAMPQE